MTQENSQIEKVSRAMCKQVEIDNPGIAANLLENWIDDSWPNYANQAKAAIEAMQKPTDGMIGAGDAQLMLGNNGPFPSEKIYQAMLGAALKE